MIVLKSREEIDKMRTASKHAMEVLVGLKRYIEADVRTFDLEAICEEMIRKQGDIKACL